LYVAHEMVQMIPLAGMETYQKMLRLNEWIYEYLPNASTAPELLPTSGQAYRQTFIQRALEIALSLPFGNWLEKWEMNRKISKLTREQSSSFESYFSADVCKGHIDKHGENVITALAVRLQKTI
jgi:ATP-dependent exoDNAse (exonuclease V) alpha subunit